MNRFAVDTGPIVALLNSRDAWHKWTRATLGQVKPPLVTCEAVLSEAAFLVRRLGNGSDAVLELVSRGVLSVEFNLAAEIAPVRKLMSKYKDVPMSLADACLVRMTEMDTRLQVITLDTDFRIYRRLGRQVIPIVAP